MKSTLSLIIAVIIAITIEILSYLYPALQPFTNIVSSIGVISLLGFYIRHRNDQDLCCECCTCSECTPTFTITIDDLVKGEDELDEDDQNWEQE